MLSPLSARLGSLSRGWAVFCLIFLLGQITNSRAAEFPLNGALPGDQTSPAAVAGEDGGFLVWADNRTVGKSRKGIMASPLSGSLLATGTPFRVNQETVGIQDRPQVIRFANGKTLFVWENQHPTKGGLYARIMDATGSFLSGDIPVSSPPTSSTVKEAATWSAHFQNKWRQRTFRFRTKVLGLREGAGLAGLALLANGQAAVVYQGGRRYETNTWRLEPQVRVNGFNRWTNNVLRPKRLYGDCMSDIFVQRIDTNGQKVGPELLVNQYVDNNQRSPSLATLSNGNFVVTWVSESAASGQSADNFRIQIKARIIDPQGQPVSNEFTLSSHDDLVHGNPAVAALANGGFVALWSRQESSSSQRWDVAGRVFGVDGLPLADEFVVNTSLGGDQFGPRIAASGNAQMVVWTSVTRESREDVYGRLLNGGVVTGGEFRLNDTTVSRQFQPMVSAAGATRFLTGWSSYVGETGFDLFGRLISQ